MGRWAIIIALLVLLAASGYALYVGWTLGGAEVEVSGQGYFAMTLGIIFSLVVGCGLMLLLFYSSRYGYDDEVSPPQRDDQSSDKL